MPVGYYYAVLSNIGFTIKGGQKAVITGFNGIGKSTLLKTLIGEIPSMNGHYKFSDQVSHEDNFYREWAQNIINIEKR